MEETNDTQSIAASLDEKLGETPAQGTPAVSDNPEGESSLDAPATEAQEAEERLLAGKYKTPEELEKAYKEAERKLGSSSKEASVAKKLAELSGQSIEELEAAIEEQRKQKLIDAGKNPEIVEMQEQLNQMKAEREKERFSMQFEGLLRQYPQLKEARAGIEEIYMNRESGSVEDIVAELYLPVINAAREDASQKLETKVASNPQTTQGSGPEVSDVKKDALKRAATDSQEGVAAALDMLGITK